MVDRNVDTKEGDCASWVSSFLNMPSVVLLLPLDFAYPNAVTCAASSDSAGLTTPKAPPSSEDAALLSSNNCAFLADSFS